LFITILEMDGGMVPSFTRVGITVGMVPLMITIPYSRMSLVCMKKQIHLGAGISGLAGLGRVR
jgi:hypothetical protein